MIKAVIFDMDGVIADTQEAHTSIEFDIQRRFGIQITPEEIHERYSGFTYKEQLLDVFRKNNIQVDIEPLLKEKLDRVVAKVEQEVSSIPGVLELIDTLRNNFRLAVATSSREPYASLVLSKLKVKDKFDTLVTAKDVIKGKPNPEVFLKAAERLCVKPEECIVIEDAVAGMKAAKAAGMKCIGLVKDTTKDYPADLLVDSLEKINIDTIKSI